MVHTETHSDRYRRRYASDWTRSVTDQEKTSSPDFTPKPEPLSTANQSDDGYVEKSLDSLPVPPAEVTVQQPETPEDRTPPRPLSEIVGDFDDYS